MAKLKSKDKISATDLFGEFEDDGWVGKAYELVQEAASGLRRMRKRAGLTQDQMAEKIGVSQSRISQLESGLMDHAPSLEMIGKYAHACKESTELNFAGDRGNGLELLAPYNLEADFVSSVLEHYPEQASANTAGDGVYLSGEPRENVLRVLNIGNEDDDLPKYGAAEG